ncbi:O-antigen ligase family protein [Pseudomonas sp. LS44]|uniref:O-antigen ligase family protein n=1 Tax=Pseudomonas sp. LS44 TaxID=1357074 RepID=UPI00215B0814|nr:O-antigen ligase family protein [Pseudomonas sp. LS44]UVE18320.1 O-antigen ligase family protein [Pseudomonas sp. LS44]
MPLSASPPFSRLQLNQFIARRWLPLGYLVLLSGLFWVGERNHYSKLYYLLMAFPALLGLIAQPRALLQLLRTPIVLAFLAFAAWLLLSLSWTSSTENLASLAKRPLYVFMLFASCTLMVLHDERMLPRLLRLGAGLALVAALVIQSLHFLTQPPDGRLIGTGGLINPLLTSHVLGFFCIYWLAAWATEGKSLRVYGLLGAAVLLGAVLATGSRTPLMAIGLASLWLALMAPQRRTLYLIGGLSIAGLLLALCFPDLLLARGLSYRPQLWTAAFEQHQTQPWLGLGYDAPLQLWIEGFTFPYVDPHNVGLAVALELGLVGLLLWLVLYGMVLGTCVHHRADQRFQLASTLVIYGLAAGMTEGSSFLSRPNESWFLIWIPLSMVAALSISQRLQAAKP